MRIIYLEKLYLHVCVEKVEILVQFLRDKSTLGRNPRQYILFTQKEILVLAKKDVKKI